MPVIYTLKMGFNIICLALGQLHSAINYEFKIQNLQYS